MQTWFNQRGEHKDSIVITNQGAGRSKKTAVAPGEVSSSSCSSTLLVTKNPSLQTSRCTISTNPSSPCLSISSVNFCTRSLWNSKLKTFPLLPSFPISLLPSGYPLYAARAPACVKLPLPAPASINTDPGRTCNLCRIKELSGVYTTCVLCGRLAVHNSAVGAST